MSKTKKLEKQAKALRAANAAMARKTVPMIWKALDEVKADGRWNGTPDTDTELAALRRELEREVDPNAVEILSCKAMELVTVNSTRPTPRGHHVKA